MWTSAISHCSSAPGARGTLSWTSPAQGLLILESRSRLGLLSHLEAGLGLGRCLAPTAVGVRPQCPDTWTFPGGLGDLPAQQLASPGVTDQETPRWKQCLGSHTVTFATFSWSRRATTLQGLCERGLYTAQIPGGGSWEVGATESKKTRCSWGPWKAETRTTRWLPLPDGPLGPASCMLGGQRGHMPSSSCT